MKASLTYGFLMAIGGAVLTLLLFFAGYHDSSEKMDSAQWIGMIGGLAIAVTCLTLAMRDRRARRAGDLSWGYGSAFGVGVLTGLFATLFSAVFAYIYFASINPEFADVVLELQTEKMAEAGATSAQIDQIEPTLRKWMSPGMLTVTQVFSGLLTTVVLSLILAIFHRRPLPPPAVEAPPALA